MIVIKYSKINNIALVTDYVANGSFKSLKRNVNYVPRAEGFAKVIRLKDFRNNFNGPFRYVDKKSYNFLRKTKLFGGEIIISNVGAYAGTIFRAPYNIGPMTLGPNAILVKTNNDNYYYYLFLSNLGQKMLSQITSGSVQPKFNKTAFRKLKVPAPSIDIQNKIVNYLMSLDNKIVLNKQINKNLIKFANFIFLKEFNKSYYGTDTLGKHLNIYDRRRIPLSKIDRSKMPGKYRYVGPTSVLSHINKFNFEGTYVLLGEDGTVHDSKYHPIVQYIWGKFWPNNHTHVLQGKDISNEWLYLFLRNVNIKGLITGAVQQKINQRNLKSIHISIPSKIKLDKFQQIISPVFTQVKELAKQNIVLNKLKHNLLLKFFN